jgi:hypothetical protein
LGIETEAVPELVLVMEQLMLETETEEPRCEEGSGAAMQKESVLA